MKVITRRATYSRIAEELEERLNNTELITVADCAPCNITDDGTTPEREGWDLVQTGNLSVEKVLQHLSSRANEEEEIWYRTSTVGGAAKLYMRKIK